MGFDRRQPTAADHRTDLAAEAVEPWQGAIVLLAPYAGQVEDSFASEVLLDANQRRASQPRRD
ncbi:MAG: hypothetical protein ACPGO6_07395 [Candidatus Poseidoniaceae archaeon]